MNGLLAARRIRETVPDTRILMLSMHSEETWVRQAFERGMRISSEKHPGLELVSAIERVAAARRSSTLKSPCRHRSRERDSGLSARELEVLQLIVEGKSNKEIAAQLGLSVNTIAVHRANIMETLHIHKTRSWW
jgi:DNA-binding NarL/FixJ family response regulator